MKLTSVLTTYDSRWTDMFATEAKRLRPVFGPACVAIYHVGSTAVEGLVAKPEIDVLVIVSDAAALADWQVRLRDLGYRRGRNLVPGHHFFKRDEGVVRTHKLHVCEDGHAQAHRMLRIRDRLRDNAEDRHAYAALKLWLEKENKTGIAEYLEGKAPFLDQLYARCEEES
ncbi:MAG: GrpB family protein [Paracoccaceae bacterium]